MPAFKAEVLHALGQAQAIARLKSFMEQVREQYKDDVSQISGAWKDHVLDFSLTTFGMTVKGTLTVEDAAARVAGQLPLAAAFFRGKIEQSITSELQKALA
jgi:Putative polyhydroxyalkanoic acid system protein (PHA_gran_rgn)